MNKAVSLPVQAIILAAGRPTNRILTNTNLPDAMIPINGKPVISYGIEDIVGRDIREIVLVLHESDRLTENYVRRRFKDVCTLTVIYNDSQQKSIGFSLYAAVNGAETDKKSVLLYLGDTIYKGGLDFTADFLVVSDTYEEPDKWCFVENTANGLHFINKPKIYQGDGSVLSGVYFFTDGNYFADCVCELGLQDKEFEIKDILELYVRKYSFDLVKADKWYDCGNIENFYKAKIDFLNLRSFNTMQYDDLYGSITKSGLNKKKILEEINWYIRVPAELQIFAPRLIDYDLSEKNPWYTLEFYGYQSLADLFVFNSLDIRVWNSVVDRLFRILSLFKTYKAIIPFDRYDDMYATKTKDRLTILKKNSFWKKLLSQKTVVINGRRYNNVDSYFRKLDTYIKKELVSDEEMTFIHGDLCMSNILFDPTSRIFKFVDPGGRFGKMGICGDLKYDVAKLRHSFSGYYDFIMADLFDIEYENGEFSLTLYTETYHDEIRNCFDKALVVNGFSLERIKVIESLLFLSMIPYHDDNKKRQMAMFCRGIQLLNESVLSKM